MTTDTLADTFVAADTIVVDSMIVAVDSAKPCAPVKVVSFTSTKDVPLACDAINAKAIFDETLPDRGRAVGRITLKVRHVGAAVSNVIHFWNARVEVGKTELAYGIGDDVCPGTRATRQNVGLGVLDDTHAHVKVMSYQGSSPCTDGALVAEAGSKLDVWIEDAACPNQDIKATSYYATAGIGPFWEWPTMMAKVISTSITTEASESLQVLGVIEGTPHMNPNTTCGSEAATLVMQTILDGGILSTTNDVVPASGGMGHLVLSSDTTQPVSAGKHTIDLLAGSNFASRVTTGGCCGDGTIVAIRRR